jgi:acetylornithine deacetylase/succinyl-diaminopimelate desuccinylase-like protein
MKHGKTVAWNLATTEKKRVELTLIATGPAGHPADLNPDAAVPKLLRALDRIAAFKPPTRVIPSVDHYFKQIAPRAPPEDRASYADIRTALEDPKFEKRLLADPVFAPLLRTTYAVTLLNAGEKSNIVPGQATAVLDFRMLPGEDATQFFDELKKAVGDRDVEFRYAEAEPATESSLDTDFYRAVLKARDQFEPGVPLLTPPLTSATDAPAFRGRGITVYGFEPYHLAEEDDQSHGDNERLSRENLIKAIAITQFIVKELAKGSP